MKEIIAFLMAIGCIYIGFRLITSAIDEIHHKSNVLTNREDKQ